MVEKENRKTSELQFKYGPSLLSCFIERGRYSNHTYQPNVNHRHLDMTNFHFPFLDNNNRTIQPLMTSLLTPDEKHDFSSGDKMSVAFYELNDTKGMSPKQITEAGLTPVVTQTAMDVNDDTFAIGKLKDRAAGLVTVAGMQRCLQFFNYKQEESASPEVLHEDFVTLMKMLAEVDLSTHETMQETLIEKFDLSYYFTVQKNMTMEANIAAFGDLLRAFVPLRIACYDGQHRLIMMTYAATGQWHPLPTIHECSYEHLGMGLQDAVVRYKLDLDDEITRTDTALYKSQIIAITTLKTLSFNDYQMKLQSLGRVTTHNQSNYISQNTDQIIFAFLMEFKAHGMARTLLAPNYEIFWRG